MEIANTQVVVRRLAQPDGVLVLFCRDKDMWERRYYNKGSKRCNALTSVMDLMDANIVTLTREEYRAITEAKS